MGLVTAVFDERTLSSLQGDLALGHVRYSTTGPSTWHNAQPVYRSVGAAGFALGHNGNLTNTRRPARRGGHAAGHRRPPTAISSPSCSHASSRPTVRVPALDRRIRRRTPADPGDHLELALNAVLPRLEGAFSLGLMDDTHLVAVRDPHGFRPLCLGRLELDGGREPGWVIASESPALAVVGAQFVREIEPGEMVVIDEAGPRSSRPWLREQVEPRLCVFEFVYFARPDSLLHGREVYAARRRMGELLADQAPVEADLVMGVPDSGASAAEGYSARSGIPFGQGLVKNRYIGRTFIAPDAGGPRPRRPSQAEPVELDHRGQAARRDRRLHRARDDDAPAREAAPRGGSGGGAPADLVAAVSLAVLLRDRHADRDELIAAPALDRGDHGASGCRLARLLVHSSTSMEAVGAPGPGQGYCDACLTGRYTEPPGADLPGARVSGPRGSRRPGGPDDPLRRDDPLNDRARPGGRARSPAPPA